MKIIDKNLVEVIRFTVILHQKIKEVIQEYIVRTQYLEYMGKGFIKNIPFFGPILNYVFGPNWNSYYLQNMSKFNKFLGKKKPKGN